MQVRWSAAAMGSGNVRSIVAMVVAVGFFALMDSVLKTLSAHYPATQVAALRGWTALPLVLGYLAWRRSWARVWRVRWPLHAARGVLAVVMLTSFTWGLQSLPLANAYTLFFVAPLLITLLAIPILGERVRRAHLAAIVAGLVGVVIALRPAPGAFLGWAGLAVLLSAACYAASAVLGRLACRTDAPDSLVWWSMVALAAGGTALAWPHWQPVRAEHAPWLLALAATGFVAQIAITEAFRHGQASAVAPFEYTALVWGVALDVALWGVWPDAPTLLGAAVVIGAGLYLLRHERLHARRDLHTGTPHP
ncbi:DMT family transporter [Tepidimonas taiwanensis]|nr:DMT family transporter [Tepidimonas taiwanensis]MCX7691828.1 DMT family transporter [Tepidimonas taiwanensis]